MSLLSSTVNDDEELVDDNKENNEGCSIAKNAESNKIGSGSVGRGQHRRPWKLLSSSSDEALHQRSSEQPHRSVGHQQPHRSAGHNHPPAPGGVFAASVDRILIPLGSSPVLNVRNGAGNSATITGNGATITGSGAVKESRLRDVEPLLAASPNILGKSGPRVIHAKPNGHPMGTVYCIAYTPPNRNRTQSSGSGTPNSDFGSGGSKRGELFHAHAPPPTIDEEGEFLSNASDGRRLNSAQKHYHGVDSTSLERSAHSFMSPVAGHRNHRVTPSTPRTNPFENYDPSELTMSIISPSVFGISKERSKINGSTADKDPSASENVEESDTSSKPFRWSIDQLAILYPADIDITDKEVSKQEIYRTPDLEYEKKVEAAIDEYFSQNFIVPSPWIGQSGAKHQSRLNDLMDCNGSPILNSSAGNGGAEGSNGNADSSAMNVGRSSVAASCRMTKSANTSTAQPAVREVSCQTKLTIPFDIDLEKILGAYMSTTEEVVVVNSNDSSFTSRNNSMLDGGNCVGNDILSTSTLRRKLFSHLSEDDEPGHANGSKAANEGDGSTKIRIKPLPDASDSPKAFNPLDVTPPPIYASSDQVTPADLQYVSSSPIRGSGHSPISRKKGGSPRLCMFPRASGSCDQLDLTAGLDTSSVQVMDLGSAQKPFNPISSDVKRPDLASLRSPPCSPIFTSSRPAIRTSSSPPYSPIGRATSSHPAIRSSSSPPCSPIGPASASHPAVAAIHASSSPLVRRLPRSQSPSSSSSSQAHPIPFMLATPPQLLRPGLLGRGGGDSTSKERFPSPDISPIKDGINDLVNGETEDDINRSSNDILDDDPTPQSLAIHSMTQGDDEEDDLSGNDPDVSQFVTSGMEVDTPVKFEMGETSMRHRLLEHQIILHQRHGNQESQQPSQPHHHPSQQQQQQQHSFQPQQRSLHQSQPSLQHQHQRQLSPQQHQHSPQQQNTPHPPQQQNAPHPSSSSTRFSFDNEEDSLLDASRLVDASYDRSTDYEPSMMEISNSEFPPTTQGAAAGVSASHVGADSSSDSSSSVVPKTKHVDQIVAAPLMLSGISPSMPAFSSSGIADTSSFIPTGGGGDVGFVPTTLSSSFLQNKATSAAQTCLPSKFTFASTSATSFINSAQSRFTSGNSIDFNLSNAVGLKWSEPLCLSTPLPPNLLSTSGSNGSKIPVALQSCNNLSDIGCKRETPVDVSNVLSKLDQESASGISSHRENKAFHDSAYNRAKGSAAKLLIFPNETGVSDNSASFSGVIDPFPPSNDGVVDHSNIVIDNSNIVIDNSTSVLYQLPPPEAESTAVSAATEADNALYDEDRGGEGMLLNATAPQHQLSWVAPLVASTPTRRKFAETDNN